jgi:hypothetical protein
MMHYVEHKILFDYFVNKYNVPSVNVSQITAFKNKLVKA